MCHRCCRGFTPQRLTAAVTDRIFAILEIAVTAKNAAINQTGDPCRPPLSITRQTDDPTLPEGAVRIDVDHPAAADDARKNTHLARIVICPNERIDLILGAAVNPTTFPLIDYRVVQDAVEQVISTY